MWSSFFWIFTWCFNKIIYCTDEDYIESLLDEKEALLEENDRLEHQISLLNNLNEIYQERLSILIE